MFPFPSASATFTYASGFFACSLIASQNAFTVTIHEALERRQNFGQVSNSYVRVIDEDTNQELLNYELGEDFSIETAIVVCEIYRHNGEWKFNALGSGFEGGLEALCKNFGVNI